MSGSDTRHSGLKRLSVGRSFSVAALLSLCINVVPAATHASPGFSPFAERSLAARRLFECERLQLRDNVIPDFIRHHEHDSQGFWPFNFGSHARRQAADEDGRCKTYPGDLDWPSESNWARFNELAGGVVFKAVPEASVCFPSWPGSSTEKCAALTESWMDSYKRGEDPTSIRAVLYQGMTCMPPPYTAAFLGNTGICTHGGFPQYIVKAQNAYQIQLAVGVARELRLRLVIRNTGHDFGAKSTGGGSLEIWTHYLKETEFYKNYTGIGYQGPAFKLGAGVQVYEANKLAKQHNVTLVGGEGATVGFIGGYVQGGGHSPLTSKYGIAADHVLEIQVVTADGKLVTANARTNPDLYWAICGGGGSTFGVVTSMIIKAYPRMTVTTMRYDIVTSPTFTPDTFWAAHRAYLDHYEDLAAKGFYSYYRIRHPSTSKTELATNMGAMVAPNMTETQFRAAMAPLWATWKRLGVPFNPTIKEYDNYSDAWEEGFPLEPWLITMRQASRIFPRSNFASNASRAAVSDALRWTFEQGANLILFNMGSPPSADVVDNAVNPAWRKSLLFAIMVAPWNVTDSPAYVESLSRNLTEVWNAKWRAMTPGSGTYMSESDYIEPGWQQSFHGSKYARLLEIKRKVDPLGVFYATNAVGSEDWELQGKLLGHLPSQDSRLCRKA